MTQPINDSDQLPARVYVRDEHILVIDDLEIKESEVVELVKQQISEGSDPEELIENLIKIGAKAALVMNANSGAETIKNALETTGREINQSARAVQEQLTQQLQRVNSEDGELQQSINNIIRRFSADLEQAFAGEDTPIRLSISQSLEKMNQTLTQDVQKKLATQRTEIATLLDPKDPTSPLRILMEKVESLDGTVKDVERALAGEAIRQEVESNAPIGGVRYEDRALEALGLIALATGDNFEPTGTTTGYVRNSRSGDAVIEFPTGNGTNARIVIEAKDTALKMKEWHEEIEKSKKNRKAEGFIGLCSSPDYMPNSGQRIWLHDSKTVVIAFDPKVDSPELLRTILQFVKLSTMTRNGFLDQESSATVMSHLNGGLSTIQRLEDTSRHLTSIETARKGLASIIAKVQEELEDELNKAQRVLIRALEGNESLDDLSGDSESEN